MDTRYGGRVFLSPALQGYDGVWHHDPANLDNLTSLQIIPYGVIIHPEVQLDTDQLRELRNTISRRLRHLRRRGADSFVQSGECGTSLLQWVRDSV